MAKIETMTFYGKAVQTLNIEKPVGAGVKHGNSPSDVMVIQALLRFIWTFVPQRSGLKNGNEVPVVNGIFDKITEKAIRSYQQAHSRELLRTDGRVDPANYSGRNINHMDRRVMTMTLLHMDADNASLIEDYDNQKDYVPVLTRKFPQLLLWLH